MSGLSYIVQQRPRVGGRLWAPPRGRTHSSASSKSLTANKTTTAHYYHASTGPIHNICAMSSGAPLTVSRSGLWAVGFWVRQCNTTRRVQVSDTRRARLRTMQSTGAINLHLWSWPMCTYTLWGGGCNMNARPSLHAASTSKLLEHRREDWHEEGAAVCGRVRRCGRGRQ